MSYQQEYEKWLNSSVLSEKEHEELLSIQGNDKEIESRFFAPLEFGTAGLRGTMEVGLRRMNVYVVRQTTQAFAKLILQEGEEAREQGVAISYDSRHHSTEFAEEAACVLAANGIKVYLFDDVTPTPELSFAIRFYGCVAGINITASHNPKEYNGYKVYWSDGAQLPPEHAAKVAALMEETDIFTGILTMPFDDAVASGKITMLSDETNEEFLACALSQVTAPEKIRAAADELKIVYTPFHGAGYKLVPEALKRLGMKHVYCVPEQMTRDGDFPTVKSPNPEDKDGFKDAIRLAKEKDANLIIGTDPDSDRVGIVLRNDQGEYVTLTGNQVGVLLLDYIINAKRENGTLSDKAAAITTIVSTNMATAVGKANGVEVFRTFTGFKFIAEIIKGFEDTGSHDYIFGFEESYGYLTGNYARDKDAVTATVLITEMAASYSLKGMTLYEAMQTMYQKYGYYEEKTFNLVMPGLDGLTRMANLMADLRKQPPVEIAGEKVLFALDYKTGERKNMETGAVEAMELKNSNVLAYELEDGTTFIVRPSGTEPKVKVYALVKGDSMQDCDRKIDSYGAYAESLKN